jgi:hypothetical protein
MINVKTYIVDRREARLRGEYSNRNPIYIHGQLALVEALIAFSSFGKLDSIQECSKGRRVLVWDKDLEWERLERSFR